MVHAAEAVINLITKRRTNLLVSMPECVTTAMNEPIINPSKSDTPSTCSERMLVAQICKVGLSAGFKQEHLPLRKTDGKNFGRSDASTLSGGNEQRYIYRPIPSPPRYPAVTSAGASAYGNQEPNIFQPTKVYYDPDKDLSVFALWQHSS